MREITPYWSAVASVVMVLTALWLGLGNQKYDWIAVLLLFSSVLLAVFFLVVKFGWLIHD